jgi:hypothetical protein
MHSSKVVWSIVSNAADKSNMTNTVGWALARDISMLLLIFSRAVSDEWLDLYADWYRLSKFETSRWVLIWLTTTPSTSLDINDRPDIGRLFFGHPCQDHVFFKLV